MKAFVIATILLFSILIPTSTSAAELVPDGFAATYCLLPKMKAFLIATILLSSLLIATNSTLAGDKEAVVCNDPKKVNSYKQAAPPKRGCKIREGCRGPPTATPHTSTPR
ncbi:hypothetical protein SLEP1_g27429 [Rubroshorea leprosula]|uniref:Uncharacterized protein n=1 Tax=Rubroshorea leprosula TaxID=152421 RepID=A0AAV5K307_9ROSI|nr:hypothetical protein SLEP1_g27429 [Rubroshorea leprosula]